MNNASMNGNILSSGKFALILLIGFFLSRGPDSHAQWITQEITLNPGWNAVYLQVNPANPICNELFASVPQVESVWKYDRRFTSVQFQNDPTILLPDPAHWIYWLPASRSEAFLGRLLQLRGGAAYMVKVDDRASSFTWRVKGIPASPENSWIPNNLNLVGFAVSEGSTVAQFFRGVTEISVGPGAISEIYSVRPDGSETQLRQPERAGLNPNAAYWVRVRKSLASAQPFSLHGEYQSAGKLDFGDDRVELTLTLQSQRPTNALTLSIRSRASEAAPFGHPELAGRIPLARFVSDPISKTFAWRPITDEFEITLGPGERQELRLAIQRSQLAPYRVLVSNGASYQELLEIREFTHHSRVLVPIVAKGAGITSAPKTPKAASVARDAGGLPDYALSQGLWVGEARITHVNRPSYSSDSVDKAGEIPKPASSTLKTRLLVHVDTNGTSRILQRALLAWSGGTNGQYLNYADEPNVPPGTNEVLRISSVAFPIMSPQAMNGVFGQRLQGSVALDYDDPVNPFKHTYHPDHDNLDEAYSTNKLSEGIESFSVRRDIALRFLVTHELTDGTFAPPGAVLKLNGVDAYVTADPVSVGDSATISAWVKIPTAPTNTQYIFSFSNGDNDLLALSVDGDRMTLSCTASNAPLQSSVTTTNPFPAGQWVHVAAVVDGLGPKSANAEGRIYWNGVLVGAGSMNFPAGLTRGDVYFGRGTLSDGGFLNGSIYGLGIWGEAREDTAVSNDMRVGYSDYDYLIAYFGADSGSGATLSDDSGGPMRALLQGTAWDDGAGFRAAFWDIGEREGVYLETIAGLRPQAILLQGTFQLSRINKDGALR